MSNELRDKLAKEHGLNKYPVQNIQTRTDFTQDINFARRITHTDSFQAGWDACEKHYKAEIDELKQVIEEFSLSAIEMERLCSHLAKAKDIFCRSKDIEAKVQEMETK